MHIDICIDRWWGLNKNQSINQSSDNVSTLYSPSVLSIQKITINWYLWISITYKSRILFSFHLGA